MCRLGRAGEAAARCLVGVPSDDLRLLVGQELAGFRLATCLLLSLAPDLVVCLVVVLRVCSRSTPPLLGLSRSLFDELEPCGGVFASIWVCAFEMGYKLAPLTLPGVQQKFGRGPAQQVPSLPCALNFDLGFISLAIGGSVLGLVKKSRLAVQVSATHNLRSSKHQVLTQKSRLTDC